MDKSEIYRRALSVTADVYDVSVSDIESKVRRYQVSNARHMLHFVLREYCGFSTKDMMEYTHSKSSYSSITMKSKISKDLYSSANCRYIVNYVRSLIEA